MALGEPRIGGDIPVDRVADVSAADVERAASFLSVHVSCVSRCALCCTLMCPMAASAEAGRSFLLKLSRVCMSF
eukprot:3173220-Pyramimonas_sp.AAC.1